MKDYAPSEKTPIGLAALRLMELVREHGGATLARKGEADLEIHSAGGVWVLTVRAARKPSQWEFLEEFPPCDRAVDVLRLYFTNTQRRREGMLGNLVRRGRVKRL